MDRSVVVGVHVHAQPELLPLTLRSLPDVDVLVLGDGPDARTRDALVGLELRQSTTLAPLGAPACLNRLARSSEAEVVVLLESGAIGGPRWLDRLLAAFEDPRVGLAGPSTNLAWNEQAAFPGRSRTDVPFAGAEAFARFGTSVRSLAPHHGVADFCIAFRRAALADVGAADEGYGLGPCWEMEYAARALRAGWTTVWAAGAYVYRSPYTPRRRLAEEARFEASKRRYQDAVCGLKLRGERAGYAPSCDGDVCEHFAPAALMRVHREFPAAPVAPLVSCIMPTGGRAEYALQAVRYFQRQDQPRLELIIVDDGDDGLGERLPDDPRIHYLRARRGESIGAKRNTACAAAQGEFIVHFDDDDWFAPERVRRQVEPLLAGEADVSALRAGVFFEPGPWRFWRITDELHRRLFVEDVHGGTLAYRRRVWEDTRFPAVSLAEDAAFLRGALQRGARLQRLDDDGLFVYVRHGAAAWSFACGTFQDADGWVPVGEPGMLAGDRAFYAARTSQALVSCIMPTADRPEMVTRAIGYFLRQDHEARELLVVDDGRERVASLIPDDPRIRYVGLDRPLVLGAKRNHACELARGEVILHWDDDDWMAPGRIGFQVEQLAATGADACGSSELLYLDPARRAAWHYRYPRPGSGWVTGNSLAYTAASWRRSPFAALAVGEDSRFVLAAGRRVHEHDHRMVVGIVHAGNTSPKQTVGAAWQPVPVETVADVLGADAGQYLG